MEKKIYNRIEQALEILRGNKGICNRQMMRDVGKLAIFYPAEKLRDFSKQYLGKNISISEIIAEIIITKSERQNKVELHKKVMTVFKEAQRNYEKCVFGKFVNLVRGAEIAGADTLVLGKIG